LAFPYLPCWPLERLQGSEEDDLNLLLKSNTCNLQIGELGHREPGSNSSSAATSCERELRKLFNLSGL